MEYKKVDKELSKDPSNCAFCKHLQNKEIVVEHDLFFIVPNIFPYLKDHILLLPKRHLHSEADFSQEELLELSQIHVSIIKHYKNMFGSCFHFTREHTPGQTQWHWHRHYVKYEHTIIPEAPRVPYDGLDDKLVTLLNGGIGTTTVSETVGSTFEP